VDNIILHRAGKEIAQLMNTAKAHGSCVFKAGRITVECIGLFSEYAWKVAGKDASEDVVTRIIARYLQEETATWSTKPDRAPRKTCSVCHERYYPDQYGDRAQSNVCLTCARRHYNANSGYVK
jgi:hypothetical protein